MLKYTKGADPDEIYRLLGRRIVHIIHCPTDHPGDHIYDRDVLFSLCSV